MGKVRAISPEEQELKAKEAAEKEAARLARIEEAKAKGQAKKELRVKSEELREKKIKETEETKEETAEPKLEAQEEVEAVEAPKKAKKVSKYAAKQKSKTRERSENYQKAAQMVDKSKLYTTKEALALLDKAHLAKFDETVELHINTTSAGLSGQVTLPHGTGKAVRVAILNPSKDAAGAEALLKDIEAGKISFDVLVATPDAMPKLARVARVLGPKGLMPNPKTGTVSTNPEAVAKSYEGGQMHYKTEAKTPVMHLAVGKLSFGAEKLSQNIESMLKAVKMENIKKVTVKSTMSPGIRLLVK
ncbi:MAG TPA: hypothetical protein VEW42_03150 [Candidatus Eisenbacteria bacterium]|nr:hypothetical protein [Candidatus Eisenbacteria bacterium]